MSEGTTESPTDAPPRRRWVPWWLPVLAAAGSTMLIGVIAFHSMRWGLFWKLKEVEAWGQFGDFVGGMVNPIMSFLTLIAVLVTVALQGRQLALSQEELKLTREELARSASAQEALARASSEQLLLTLKTAEAQIAAAEEQRRSADAMQRQAQYTLLAAQAQTIEASLAHVEKDLERWRQRASRNQAEGERMGRRRDELRDRHREIVDALDAMANAPARGDCEHAGSTIGDSHGA